MRSLDAGQLISKLEAHQVVADELAGGQPPALPIIELPGPFHEFEGDHGGIGFAVGDPFGHDMPDDHQQPAGDGHDRFAALHPIIQLLEFLLPERVMLHCPPCRFHQGPAQFLAALFGDRSGGMGLPAVMDTAAQTRVAHQLLGSGKAGDIPDGRKHRHGVDQPKARKLEQIGCMSAPGGGGAQASQFLVDLCCQEHQVIQRGEILAYLQPLHGRKR